MAIRTTHCRMMLRLCGLALLIAALALGVPRRVEAQISSRSDEAVLKSYELTMPKFEARSSGWCSWKR